MRKFKGKGVGAQAFKLTLAKHYGRWLTRALPNNIGAKEFWMKVIGQNSMSEIDVTTELYKTTEMLFIRYRV